MILHPFMLNCNLLAGLIIQCNQNYIQIMKPQDHSNFSVDSPENVLLPYSHRCFKLNYFIILTTKICYFTYIQCYLFEAEVI